MRIISGTLKGRRFSPPKNFRARPTTDTAREALFNVLSHSLVIEELKVLDLFSGTGAISYEFASRGSIEVVSIEKDAHHQKYIKKNVEEFDLTSVINCYRADVFNYLKYAPKDHFNLVFADPPFDLPDFEKVHEAVLQSGTIAKGGLFILEHGPQQDFSQHPKFQSLRKYGKVNFTFLKG